MDVPMILGGMADRIKAAVPEVAAAHYPAPNRIDRTPAVVLYWGSDGEDTVIQTDMRGRMWLPVVKAQLLGARLGDTPEEFAVIDRLITPVVDAFDTGLPASLLAGLDGHVDRVQVTRLRPSIHIFYAGHTYYGAELFFSIKFHRRPGG